MNQDIFNCTPSEYPPFEDQLLLQEDSPSPFDPTVQFLIPGYRFHCEGRVSQWEVYTTGNGSHPVEFTVWRLDSTATGSATGSATYTLVGSNYFNGVAPDESNLLSLPIAAEDQIEVRPGDIAGLRSILLDDTAISPFQIQLSSAGRGVITYSLNRTAITPQTLSVSTSQLQGGTPVFRATVECKC